MVSITVSERYWVDTAVVLRFLSGQSVKQADAARRLFEAVAFGGATLEVSPVIVAETLDTLISFYGIGVVLGVGGDEKVWHHSSTFATPFQVGAKHGSSQESAGLGRGDER